MNASDEAHEWVHARLGAYADGELDVDDISRVDAHLPECRACSAELGLQQTLGGRLRSLGSEPDHAEFRESLRRSLRARGGEMASRGERAGRREARSSGRPTPRRRLERLALFAGWGVAAALALVLVLPQGASPSDPELPYGPKIPMVERALDDFRSRQEAGIPMDGVGVEEVAARVGLPVAALSSPRAQLLSAWPTTLRGEPAAALAYRWRSHIVIQYVVSEELFFRQEIVRSMVREHGRYVTVDGDQSVVAWPAGGAGVLVVGDVPAADLDALRVPS